jgi:hypothetical protein
MNVPAFNDRVERKYQIGIDESQVPDLWRDLRLFLDNYGLVPTQEITSVGSVYFDNKDCDLLRFSLLGHLMLFRLRAYELFGQCPQPIAQYWVEVKTAKGERRHKRRFSLSKSALSAFLAGDDVAASGSDNPQGIVDPDAVRHLYHEAQETILTMGLNPILLVMCKRLAFQGAVDRLSIDWDVRYYDARSDMLDKNSWKYLAEPPAGKSENVILELKYLRKDPPVWFTELQRKYPIRRREYLKPVEGMGCLFNGPLKEHKEAGLLFPMIKAYMADSLLG